MVACGNCTRTGDRGGRRRSRGASRSHGRTAGHGCREAAQGLPEAGVIEAIRGQLVEEKAVEFLLGEAKVEELAAS